eukprot:6380734-Ditylum_brightwellii.AAC.1
MTLINGMTKDVVAVHKGENIPSPLSEGGKVAIAIVYTGSLSTSDIVERTCFVMFSTESKNFELQLWRPEYV